MVNSALACGVISIISIFIPNIGLGVSSISAIVAIVLGRKVMKEEENKTKGKIAVWLGILGLAIMVGVFIYTFYLISQFMQEIKKTF